MGSTENGGPSQITRQRSLFESAGRDVSESKKGERGLSSNPELPLQAEPTTTDVAETSGPKLAAASPEYVEPIWLQRIKLVIFVTFSVWLGMLLVVFPWTPVWDHNNVLLRHPELRTIFQHFFTRGAASGLGLVDVWIGIWAAVKYHDKK